MKNGDFHSFHSFQKNYVSLPFFGVSSSPSSLAIPIRVVEADEFEVVIFRATGAKQLLLTGMGRTANGSCGLQQFFGTSGWEPVYYHFFGKILEDLRNQIHEMIWNIFNLVGGFNPSDKYEFVSWNDYSQYMESHNPAMFQSPPTSNILWTNIQKSRNHSCPATAAHRQKKLLGDHAILVEINLPGCVMVNSMGVLLWALRHDKFVWPVW